MKRLLVLLLAAVAASALAACGSSSSAHKATTHTARTVAASQFDGSVAEPPIPAPRLALKDSLGRPVTLADYRGKAVFVTFLYVHCKDTCQTIASHMHAALALMGADAVHAQMVAVSVDPRGDTPPAVAHFLHVHGLTGRMQYLIGDHAQLAPVWKAWNISTESDAANPKEVGHSALVYGVSASGRLTTLYPANFKPSDLAHDVAPLLAG